MKFECLDCKKQFEYAATLTDCTVPTAIIERHVCPYCKSLNFQEYIESMPVEKIVSVKSVELDKVDDCIGQGYEVKELYAKTATMIKKSEA